MPRLKISELEQTLSPVGTDVFPIVSGGETKKVKLNTLSDFIVPEAQSAVQPDLDLKANLNGDNISASPFRTALGLVIGTNVQAYDADLGAIAALTSAADKMPYSTGAQAWAMADLTPFARTLLAGANQAAFLAALGQVDLVETNFSQAGTGAVVVTGEAKLRQASVQPNSGEFGAFTDATTTTATLLAAFTHAMSLGRVVELAGSYTINGPITPVTGVDGHELRVHLRDDVTITVVAGPATPFNRVFYTEGSTIANHSFAGGGTLTLDCGNLAAAGIWLRHNETSTGGVVNISAPVHVKNVLSGAGLLTASGIIVIGRFERVILRSPTVDLVSRVEAAGECSGISVSNFDGEVEMYNPVVKNILTGAGTADADGIKCFGRQSGATYDRREGSVRIHDPIFVDCVGRSYKDQCGDTIIYGPTVRRKDRVAATQCVEFDFQYGGGQVFNAHVEYYLDEGVSPINASSHSVCAFQQLIEDYEMHGGAYNTTVISQMAIPRFASHNTSATAGASTTEIVGLNMIPAAGFTGSIVSRGILEFDAQLVGAKPTATNLVVKNVTAPSDWPVISYTAYDTLDDGTATAGGASTLTDSGKTWNTNQWRGKLVRITGGTGAGQVRTVLSNTGTVLTTFAAWTVNPDATSVYNISHSFSNAPFSAFVSSTATAGGASTLTDSGASWTTNEWAGYVLSITSGTGSGQTRMIASNTATVLTVSSPWTTNPNATSVYTVSWPSGPKLSVTVDRCETSLTANSSTLAFAAISGDSITDIGSMMFGANPGYINLYRMSVCLKKMRAGCILVVYLDDTATDFVDTDLNTPVSVPWGTTGTLYLECKGISNFGAISNDAIIEARLNSSTVSPSAWFTQYGGVTWMALN